MSAEIKHTPGLVTAQRSFGMWSVISTTLKRTLSQPRVVAEIGDPMGATSLVEAEGDARLVAASWNAMVNAAARLNLNAVELAERLADGGIADMLGACGVANKLLSNIARTGKLPDNHEWAYAQQRLWRSISKVTGESEPRAAIAKATGQSQHAAQQLEGGAK